MRVRRSMREMVRVGWLWVGAIVLVALASCADDAGSLGGSTVRDVATSDGGDASGDNGQEDATSPDEDAGQADGNAPPVGRFAHYISSTSYGHMVMEVDSVAGMEPRQSVERELESRLTSLLDKPDGVDVIRDKTIATRGSDHAWSDQELGELAEEHFDRDVGAETIKMHVMFVDGHSERDDSDGKVLGLAWGHTHIVIFKETLEDACRRSGVIPTNRETLCSMAELSVWLHEVGHNLGLVANGLAMEAEHKDEDHGRHCDNSECLMYWAWKGPNATEQLLDRLLAGDETAPGFDDQCRADIDAAK